MYELQVMMGLWIVSIGTVPLYYLYKIWQREKCSHKHKHFRICSKCGKKERQIEVRVD